MPDYTHLIVGGGMTEDVANFVNPALGARLRVELLRQRVCANPEEL